MVECKYTAFDVVLFHTKALKTNKMKEGVRIKKEFSLFDLLDYLTEEKCITKDQSEVLANFIMMWETPLENYWEEDIEKMNRLLDKVGITEEVFQAFSEELETEVKE